VLTLVATGCAGSGDDVEVAATEATLDPNPPTSMLDRLSSTSSDTTTVSEPSASELDTDAAPPSFDGFIESWRSAAAALPESPGLAPTISAADLVADPTIGADVFVEQVTLQTVIGGIVEPETGLVTGLMGLSEPDSIDAFAMVEIIWVSAFGTEDRPRMTELFPLEDVQALEIGEQISRVHRGRSVVLNHVDGADPEDGLYVFTVGDQQLVEDDPSHDSITNVVLGVLVRTS
jgi:hypothetical protein